MKYSTVERQRTAGGSTPTYEVQNSRIASHKSRDTMQASRHGKKKIKARTQCLIKPAKEMHKC